MGLSDIIREAAKNVTTTGNSAPIRTKEEAIAAMTDFYNRCRPARFDAAINIRNLLIANFPGIKEKLIAEGLPVECYIHPESSTSAKIFFEMIGIPVYTHSWLEPNQVVLSWEKNPYRTEL